MSDSAPVKAASFAPTVSPPAAENSRFSVKTDVTVREGGEEKVVSDSFKTSIFDKFSRKKAKNSLFNKKEQNSKKEDSLSSLAAFFGQSAVPRGANTDVYRNYAGDKLSQADFERKILGVSTATEISVKSRICVKGRCFDADENGQKLT